MPTTPERMFACKATIVHRDEDVIKFGLLVTEVFEGHNGQSKEFSPKSPYRLEESADEIITATFPA